jgi:outer membrane receptor protein involved in Fe transport
MTKKRLCNLKVTIGVLALALIIPIPRNLDAQSSTSAPPASPAAVPQQVTTVTVTAYRAPISTLESPVTTRLLTQSNLGAVAPVTLDGKIRQIPGLELFRRSSSLVANPTSQGISLRGLGSTSASRTLLTQDDVPLNDPTGGWIHWQEQPELSIDSVELVRGGASDLYGSSAIGGVVSVIPVKPRSAQGALRSLYGGEGTYDTNVMGQDKIGPWGLLGAAGLIGTNGYIQQAPSQRGPIDVASNVHSQNALGLIEHDQAQLRLFLRANWFQESRHNGTPYQFNATKLLRYATGADWQGPRSGSLTLRLYGSDERYRQTFSNVANTPTASTPGCNFRCSESPTRFTFVPANEVGATAHWNQPLGAGFVLMGGAEVHDVRIWDREQTFGATAALTNLHDHQRDSAIWAEGMWVHNAWTLTASGRMDWFQNYDGHQVNWNGTAWVANATQPPQFDEGIFDPRLGLSRKLSEHWALTGSGFRAFRSPTPSELYRSTQVGNKLTRPNGGLLSERATGWEAGVASQWRWGTMRASYFLTQVNRPIVAVTTNPNSSPILLLRENLGQIESRGVSLDYEVAFRPWLHADGGYQYANATVTRGPIDVGNWIPEVPHNMATLNLRASQPKLGLLSLQSRLSGRQFDDDVNAFLIHGFFELDAYGSHELGKHIELFADAENLFDRAIEVSKTPSTTLGQPRTARFGVNVRLGGK